MQFRLPPGYCWNEIGQIEMDPDEHVRGVIRLLFDKFQEFGSARQVVLWAQNQALQLPVIRRNNSSMCKIEWRPTAYHTVLQILGHPIYAGAYVFRRTTQRTRILIGRARKTTGHTKPMTGWNVLLRDHHPGYISWEQYEANQKLISENAHMLPRTDRKSARGGRALLTGLVRCGRCSLTLECCTGTSGHAHRYQCRGDGSHVVGLLCIGVGGVSIDRAVAAQIVEAVSEHAIEAAIQAANQSVKADHEVRQRCAGNSRKPVTTPRSPHAATRLSIRPSGSSRANSRGGGTRRWNVLPISRTASPGTMTLSRGARRSIAQL